MRTLTARVLLSAVVLLAGVAALFGGVADASQRDEPNDYIVRNFPSLGGSTSAGVSINDFGLVAGYSNLPGDEVRHATLWLYGLKLDLGTLGGPNSAVLWPVKNNKGLVAGIAETDEIDPLGEAWSCSAFFPGDPTGQVCRGFVWEHGEMRPLDTLGGTHSFAAGANNAGQVVGWVETTFNDPTCAAPQVLGFHATIGIPRQTRSPSSCPCRATRRRRRRRSTTRGRSSASRASATRPLGGLAPSVPCFGKMAR